jgi:hypothetical protein
VKFNTANYNNTDVTVGGVVTTPGRIATSSLNMVKLGVAYRFYVGCFCMRRHVRFSNRPVGVKRFQAIHQYSVLSGYPPVQC